MVVGGVYLGLLDNSMMMYDMHDVYIYIGLSPPSNSGKRRFIGIPDPTNVIILVVTGILSGGTTKCISR